MVTSPCCISSELHKLQLVFYQLNTKTGAVAYSFARFGRGTGGIFLDNVNCWGTKSKLLDCTHPAIGLHNCNHGADAGVRCQGTMYIYISLLHLEHIWEALNLCLLLFF